MHTQSFWEYVTPLFIKIIQHPFLQELSKGTLKRETFIFYLEQDALYLIDFSRALTLTAAKLSDPNDIALILNFAQGALIAERDLHHTYFQTFSVIPTQKQAPACLGYTQFLLATASQSCVEEAMAALLPCFWIYQAVGEHIYKDATQDNPYRSWIDMYASEAFTTLVKQAIDLTERLATNTTPAIRERMKEAFKTSTQYEWLFWDGAYRLERDLLDYSNS